MAPAANCTPMVSERAGRRRTTKDRSWVGCCGIARVEALPEMCRSSSARSASVALPHGPDSTSGKPLSTLAAHEPPAGSDALALAARFLSGHVAPSSDCDVCKRELLRLSPAAGSPDLRGTGLIFRCIKQALSISPPYAAEVQPGERRSRHGRVYLAHPQLAHRCERAANQRSLACDRVLLAGSLCIEQICRQAALCRRDTRPVGEGSCQLGWKAL